MIAGLGAVATVLVQDGTVKPGHVLLCGRTYGKVRRMLNDRGEALKEATAGTPVVISGLSALPNAGDKVFITPQPDHIHVFDTESGLRLNKKAVVAGA